MKQWSDYGISCLFNSVVIVMVSCRWSTLLIFLVFFIIVEVLLSMHINIVSRVVCPHRIIESVAISRQIEDAGRCICCLCDRNGSRRHSAYAWICCWTVIDYSFCPSQPRRESWCIARLGSRFGTFACSSLHRVLPAHLLLEVHHYLRPPKIAVFDFLIDSTQPMESQMNLELPRPQNFALLAKQFLVQIPETSWCCCSTRNKSCWLRLGSEIERSESQNCFELRQTDKWILYGMNLV